MMSENKVVSDRGNNNGLDLGSASVDPLLHSESPRVQEIRLRKQLKEELEKNSGGRKRYVDSSLYSRNQQQRTVNTSNDRQSEVQTTTLNFAQSKDNNARSNVSAFVGSPSKSIPLQTAHQHGEHGDVLMKADSALDVRHNDDREEVGTTNFQAPADHRGCQVCLIKEVKEDLINVTKIIQDRNELLSSRLKARHLRSFFERQMLD